MAHAAPPPPRCPDCGSCRTVEFEGDLTCVGCGLVLHDRCVFVTQFNDSFEPMPEPPKPKRARRSEEDELLDRARDALRIPSAVMGVARDLMARYREKSRAFTAGADNRRAFAAACLYYAAKDVPGGGRTIDEVCNGLQVLRPLFTRAMSELCAEMGKTAIGKRVMSDGVRPLDLLNRFVSLLVLPADQARSVRQTCLRLLDMARELECTTAITPNTLVAAILYMACTHLGVKVTMKVIVQLCQTNNSSVVRTERLLHESMLEAKRRKMMIAAVAAM
jgi:transcription initiation factor TFIIIB Brf1 subunit/transcription initiation factor TFIIB